MPCDVADHTQSSIDHNNDLIAVRWPQMLWIVHGSIYLRVDLEETNLTRNPTMILPAEFISALLRIIQLNRLANRVANIARLSLLASSPANALLGRARLSVWIH